MLYQILQKHIETLKERFALLENNMIENATSRQVIGDMKSGSDRDLLIPMGSGFFMHGKSKNGSNLLTNIGSGIFITKPAEEAEQLLDKRKREIEDAQEELQNELNRTVAQLTSIASELEVAMHHGKK